MTLSTENVWTLLRDDLTGFFRRRVRDEHRVEDLVQETFLRVHDRLADVRDEDRLAAWVFRVARNVLIDQERARVHRGTGDAPFVDTPAPEPEDENQNLTVSGWARSMIELLPEEDRAALELHELQGLRQREVAERLGLSLSGAKSRIQRGRARLRASLLACCHFELDAHGNVVDYRSRRGCRECGERG